MKKNRERNELGFELYSEYADLTFVERMLLSPFIEDSTKERIKRSIIVDVNEVEKYKDSFSGTPIHYTDFPNVAPPFPDMLFCSTISSDTFEVNEGLLMEGHIIDSIDHLKEVVRYMGFSEDTVQIGYWVLAFEHFNEIVFRDDEYIGYATSSILTDVLVGPDGTCLDITIKIRKGVPWSKDLQKKARIQGMNKTCVALFALSFLHCKNVALSHKEKKDREFFKRETKEVDALSIRCHTIDITPMKTILRNEGKSESTGLKKALHICRGHFATYTEDKKLFGKVAGTFWIPQHVRGHQSVGTVEKDYRINLSEDNRS
jgi:hypothetical protein